MSLQAVITGHDNSGGEFRSEVEMVEVYRGGPRCALHVLVWDGPHGTTRAVYNGRQWVFQSGAAEWRACGPGATPAVRRLVEHFHLDLSLGARP